MSVSDQNASWHEIAAPCEVPLESYCHGTCKINQIRVAHYNIPTQGKASLVTHVILFVLVCSPSRERLMQSQKRQPFLLPDSPHPLSQVESRAWWENGL